MEVNLKAQLYQLDDSHLLYPHSLTTTHCQLRSLLLLPPSVCLVYLFHGAGYATCGIFCKGSEGCVCVLQPCLNLRDCRCKGLSVPQQSHNATTHTNAHACPQRGEKTIWPHTETSINTKTKTAIFWYLYLVPTVFLLVYVYDWFYIFRA